MHTLVHQVAQGLVNGSVTGNRVQSGEVLGDDAQKKVPAAGRSFVAGMASAVVAQLQMCGFEHRQALAYQTFQFVHGKTFLKGFTVTWA